MEIFIVLACLASVVGGLGAITGKLVYQAYSEELEESGNKILPPSTTIPSFPPPAMDEVKKN